MYNVSHRLHFVREVIRIEVEGKKQGTVAKRVKKLKESLHQTWYALYLERLKFLAEAYQKRTALDFRN